MKSCDLKHISDFEWGSVGRYINYVTSVAGLSEVNSNDVYSFSIFRCGPRILLNRKERTLKLLEANRAKIEVFAADYKECLTHDEMFVLRGVYWQYKGWIELVRGHVATARAYYSRMDGQADLFREEGVDGGLF